MNKQQQIDNLIKRGIEAKLFTKIQRKARRLKELYGLTTGDEE